MTDHHLCSVIGDITIHAIGHSLTDRMFLGLLQLLLRSVELYCHLLNLPLVILLDLFLRDCLVLSLLSQIMLPLVQLRL